MRYLIVLLWLLITLPSRSQTVKIENLRVAIDEPSKSIKITYNIVGNTKATVVRLAIYRADSTLIDTPTLRGVKEAALSPHRSKVIYWDVVADNIYANENFRFELSAEEIDNVFKPYLHWAASGTAIGGGVGSWLIWNQFNSQLARLNALRLEVDPDTDGIIQEANLHAKWRQQYSQTQKAAKQTYFYACLGVAAASAIFEIYMVLHDAKAHRKAISFAPSTSGLGVGMYYRFASKR